MSAMTTEEWIEKMKELWEAWVKEGLGMWQQQRMFHGFAPEHAYMLTLGVGLGLVVIVALKWFPGEPFDYEADLKRLQSMDYMEQVTQEGRDSDAPRSTTSEIDELIAATDESGAATSTATDDKTKQLKHRELEIEKAAARVRIDKLQAFLGVEEAEVKKLIDRAKKDALDGKSVDRQEGKNILRIADFLFYAIMTSLLVYYLWKDYGINVLVYVDKIFPREMETLRQLGILPIDKGTLLQSMTTVKVQRI